MQGKGTYLPWMGVYPG